MWWIAPIARTAPLPQLAAPPAQQPVRIETLEQRRGAHAGRMVADLRPPRAAERTDVAPGVVGGRLEGMRIERREAIPERPFRALRFALRVLLGRHRPLRCSE